MTSAEDIPQKTSGELIVELSELIKNDGLHEDNLDTAILLVHGIAVAQRRKLVCPTAIPSLVIAIEAQDYLDETAAKRKTMNILADNRSPAAILADETLREMQETADIMRILAYQEMDIQIEGLE